MPALSWNEIRQRSIRFSREWSEAGAERAEAQTFWNEFFNVFGIRRRTVAAFEEPVKSLKSTYHRIDLFWRGRLLAEHKSPGQDLDKAGAQAFQYIQELQDADRADEIPRFVILSDFARVVLYDLEPEEGDGERVEFAIADLPRNIKRFAFFVGQKTHRFGGEDEANLRAAEIMAKLHDAVEADQYDTRALERLLVRLLFCLFSDDTGIFETGQFELYIQNWTRPDGADLGAQLNALFDVLNSPPERRARAINEDLAAFPFINGELFAEPLPTAGFTSNMREQILSACRFDWSRISPAIFGSLFQGIMDSAERRQIGAHYTSERDILKVIRPLFLDSLATELERAKADRSARRRERLLQFQRKLASLKFLDPACGCGNFLVLAYRELRRLELNLLRALHADFAGAQGEVFTSDESAKLSRVDVDQFYGIEIGEWPARIAETALWLTDHQMNSELSAATGNAFQRIPLKASPHILCANALRVSWATLLSPGECSFVLGNPPFIGAKYQTAAQKDDIKHVNGRIQGSGLLDYVTMWYFRAAEYIAGTEIRCAFVSTNSIAQGEQVGVLWNELFNRGIKIHFAHQTFSWQSEARGKAHVHVVIIGFGNRDVAAKTLYEYDDIGGEPVGRPVSNIAPYLIEGADTVIQNRSAPLCPVPEIGIGNKPIDGGHYLFTDDERKAFLKLEPGAKKFFRPWIGSEEFLHGYNRWCLWLGEAAPQEIASMPEVRKRVEAVRRFRLKSKSPPTQALAKTPTRFHVENFPARRFLVIPKVSSEKRYYIPMGTLLPSTIVSDLCFISKTATPFRFGMLTSAMHMAWVKRVCGRLKSDFRYSAKLVYNNFPWPMEATEAQRAKVAELAERVIEVRRGYLDKGATLAHLYDSVTMPASLQKAHQALDRAVDRCYRAAPFRDDRERVEFLFRLYEHLTAPLAPSLVVRRGRSK